METSEPEPPADLAASRLSAFDVLLFKVCAVAIWSDGAMAAAERDHLSHLMDRADVTEADRHELRRIALHSVSRSAVLDEVDALDEADKRRLYERTLAVLTADRRLRRGELRFVNELRRRSGVGTLRHQVVLWRLTPVRRIFRLVAAAVVSAAVLVAVVVWAAGGGPGPAAARRARGPRRDPAAAGAGGAPGDGLQDALPGHPPLGGEGQRPRQRGAGRARLGRRARR